MISKKHKKKDAATGSILKKLNKNELRSLFMKLDHRGFGLMKDKRHKANHEHSEGPQGSDLLSLFLLSVSFTTPIPLSLHDISSPYRVFGCMLNPFQHACLVIRITKRGLGQNNFQPIRESRTLVEISLVEPVYKKTNLPRQLTLLAYQLQPVPAISIPEQNLRADYLLQFCS